MATKSVEQTVTILENVNVNANVNVVVNVENKVDSMTTIEKHEFTTEIYKIEIRNLGYFGIGELKKLLKNKLQLDTSKIKSPGQKDIAFVCFRSEADQLRAIELLNGYKWKGKILRAVLANPTADPWQTKKRQVQQQQNCEKKETTVATKKSRTSIEATCPLASMPYEQQLLQKSNDVHTLLKTFLKKLQRANPESEKFAKSFQFLGIEPSPQINGYRNKNEFTIGKNALDEIIVGFRLGSYTDGTVEVSAIDDLPQLPEAAKWAAKSFQEFVRSSKFQPFNPVGNLGHFRQLMVRTSTHTGEIMIVVGIYSTNLTDIELIDLKNDIKEFYANCINEQFKCTSLYYQDVKHREVGQIVSPIEHLSGTTHITEIIHNLKFRISPLAFFQNNTQAAEVLFQKVIDLAAPKKTSKILQKYLLDICCGTGAISLCFAKHCEKVLGVEIIAEAIEDAEYNAKINEIKNCKFFTGNADDYIESMVREIVYDNPPGVPLDLVAVVDPPRNGLHNKSIAAIRASKNIKRLIYIACNPMRAVRNFFELGCLESKKYKGEPFFAKTAIAVDLFPHTTHTELVVLFERATTTTTETMTTTTTTTPTTTKDEQIQEETDK